MMHEPTLSSSERTARTERPAPTLDASTAKLRIVKIQRTCVHDGPGIRSTLFFRGCNLRCAWCQNPEAINAKPDPETDLDLSLTEVVETVLRDREFYQQTGGGVTLSGGDPLLQRPQALLPLLEALRQHGIPVAVETALCVPADHVTQVLPFVSLFLVDLKVVGNEQQHFHCTRQSDKLIRQNIRLLLEQNAPVRFRMVIVPGFNDADIYLESAARYLKELGHDRIELLKYHNMYEDKAKLLGVERESLNITNDQAVNAVKHALEVFHRHGIDAFCMELAQGPKKAVFTKRVTDIQDAIRESDYHLCFEVSKLKTDFYRKHGFDEPHHLHRAKRLAHVLANKKVLVYPQELLVGNFTSKRKGGQVWEEHSGVLMALIMHQIHKQEPVPFVCDWKDRLDYFRNTVPFWSKHSLLSKVYSSLSDFLLTFSRCSEMNTGFNNNMASIAHFIVNYERLLELGTSGLIREIERKRDEKPENNPDFYEGAIIALKALEVFASRYANELDNLAWKETDPKRRRELEAMSAVCRVVPKHPATTYHEALQCMLFLHIALCLETFENALSPGRLDQILYPYYQRDVAAGILDYERAKELLALFILKMDEAILVNDGNTYLRIGRLFETMSTDQTVTAGGLDKQGNDATNELTYALLDICELQPYSVNMTARIHPKSPPQYMRRLAEVYLNGSPMPALYNDEIYIDTLRRHYDTTLEDARNYAIVGCVEPNASDDHYGNTDCANMNVVLPFLQALKGEEDDLWNLDMRDQGEKIATKFVEYNLDGPGRLSGALRSGYGKGRGLYKKIRAGKARPAQSMPELLSRFQERLNRLASSVLADHQKIEKAIRENFATPLTSSLSKGCLERGLDVNEGGAQFNSSGIQAVGITDVADSLHALDVVVYQQHLFSVEEVIAAIEADFQGERNERIREALLAVPKFGQDESPEATAWVNRTLQVYVNALAQVSDCPRNGIYSAGYYALNVQRRVREKRRRPCRPVGCAACRWPIALHPIMG